MLHPTSPRDMEADVPRPSQVEPNDPTQSQSGGERNAPGPAHERSAPRAASLESRAALAYQYACQGRLYDLTKVLEGGGGLTDAKALLRWRLEPEYHRTLLMGAASVGEGAVANYLLLLLMLVTADQEHGLAKAVNEQDETGSTALALACMGAAGGEEEGEGLVSALLEAGADVSLVDNEGYSALHMAAAFGRVEACRLVLDHVASPLQLTHLVNAQASAWHETPLWLAVKEKHTHVAALLLGKGAKVGADVEGLVRVRGLRSHGATGAQVMAKLVLGHNHITGQEDEAEDEEERHSSGDEVRIGQTEGRGHGGVRIGHIKIHTYIKRTTRGGGTVARLVVVCVLTLFCMLCLWCVWLCVPRAMRVGRGRSGRAAATAATTTRR